MATTKQGSKFVVELKGLKLPKEVEQRISTEIQQVVMREMARLDFKGDIRATFPIYPHDHIIWGIIFEPTQRPTFNNLVKE